MEQVGVSQLLEAHGEQKNEVCLTIYIEEAEYDLVERVKALTESEIGRWEHRPIFQFPTSNKKVSYQQEVYKATEPLQQFNEINLFFIRPQVTTKTQAIQLLVSSQGRAEKSWAQAANWLHHAWLCLTKSLKEEYLGYSVAYQGIIHNTDKEPAISSDILGSLWWIHAQKQSPAKRPIIAQRVQEAGWLWTVSYPETIQEGIVYLALGRDGQCEHLPNEAFVTRHSVLCSLDAFTHKGLKQGLELADEYNSFEANTIKPLQKAVSQLLRKETSQDELDKIADRIGPYTDFCWDATRLAYSIKQQISGINRLYGIEPIPPIANHHLFRVKAYEEEAQAIAAKNKDTLEIARTALSMAEARETKRANVSQEWFNFIITFVGIFLTIDQIFDTQFVNELMALYHSRETPASASKQFPLTDQAAEAVSYWSVFGNRLGSALLVTGIIFGIGLLIRWLIKRYKPKKNSNTLLER